MHAKCPLPLEAVTGDGMHTVPDPLLMQFRVYRIPLHSHSSQNMSRATPKGSEKMLNQTKSA